VTASPAAPSGYKYQYSLANSTSLPSGLSLDANTGALTGTLVVGGVRSFDNQRPDASAGDRRINVYVVPEGAQRPE
ncbi:MAG TPA: putative Ig domain-containing protein, partial [Acidobacteriota bacterium]|nr:putative Ig domain-containing protein [Acidobacteriota bacterium]